MATSWGPNDPGSGHVAWWGVTCVQPLPTWMIEPESVTVVCAPLSRRSTLLASPRPASKRRVPPRSTASVDADALAASASAGFHGMARQRAAT
jgi:hypothetical protein